MLYHLCFQVLSLHGPGLAGFRAASAEEFGRENVIHAADIAAEIERAAFRTVDRYCAAAGCSSNGPSIATFSVLSYFYVFRVGPGLRLRALTS